MGFMDIYNKFKALKEERDTNTKLTAEVDDGRLTSLQRQRNKQINEVTKARLKKQIKEYNKAKFRKDYGITPGKKKILYGRESSKATLLNDDKPLLKQRRPKVRKMFGRK